MHARRIEQAELIGPQLIPAGELVTDPPGVTETVIDELFEVIVDSAVVGLRKPDPAIYTLAARRLQLDPAAILHVGDSWEREGDDPGYFMAFGPKGYALGINAFLYALTH